MAARAFFLPGIFILFCAFILSLLVTISLPDLPTLDIVRCHFNNGSTQSGSTDTESIKEIRVNTLLLQLPLLADFTCISSVHSLGFGENASGNLLPIELM